MWLLFHETISIVTSSQGLLLEFDDMVYDASFGKGILYKLLGSQPFFNVM